MMRAAMQERFGVEHVRLGEVADPLVEDDAVLVHVRASSLNRSDWFAATGTPLVARPMMGLRKPKTPLLGADFAGVVAAVGKDVTELAVGDEVFGARSGALAEYVAVQEAVTHKPAGLSFEEAAAVPLAALTALQGLRDHGHLQPGERVLINGAGGGVGTFAVQIAKALGATVTAVCGPRNVELVGALGADRVIDYRQEDFTRTGERYDLLFDNAGRRPWRACKRVLEPEARVVLIGGPTAPLLGPLGHIAGMKLSTLRSSRPTTFFIAKPNRDDLVVLRELIDAGKVRPVIDRTYQLAAIGDALAYMGQGHICGKIVITV
jgi:NADPH:quinone reductase-like Zn-dependent oxidoreductase